MFVFLIVVCPFVLFLPAIVLAVLLQYTDSDFPFGVFKVSSSCSASGTRRVNLVTNPVINHERGKDLEVITTSGTYQIYLSC
jgi:hypothetical protein